MNARGLSTRQIKEQVEEIHNLKATLGLKISDGLVLDITDKILPI
ncbi:MAG: hypothetical protein WAO56_11365 [Miniphocaeibacter sp.]